MHFDILVLGPVELRVDGRREMYGSAKAVHMLAALALDVGTPVPLNTLAERLWDDDPPGKPNSSLHSYATRIRRRLGADRLPNEAHAYALDIDPDVVDHHRFLRLTTQARSLSDSGDDTQALALLRQAESLWRGEPLTGLGGLWAERIRRGLGERLLAATLLRAEIELGMGRFTALVPELTALVEQRPTDETVARHFMTAAYGCGRQTDALRAYETLRTLLRQEGTEPGEALNRTYRLILDRSPVGELLPQRVPGAPAAPVPDNLPAHAELVGRTSELRHLETESPDITYVHSISGMAGVGKTLLALHTARRLSQHHPEGLHYLNLHGHSAGRQPLPPETVIATLLRQLGVPAGAVPHELDELSALWRTVLATRRVVVVLDDVADPRQVRPLLAGSPSSVVLLTSRRRLSGLPGVRHISLDVLPAKESAALFAGLVGRERGGTPSERSALATLCGHLPLALELVAGRLNSRPSWTVTHLIERMSRPSDRLSEIRDGDTEIASAFALSYDTLPADHQEVFRLLGLHFGHDFGPHATAALTGRSVGATERILESLLDSHLLQEPAPDRYRLHDLIGEFALGLTTAHDTVSAREAARDRLADFSLHAAAAAVRLAHPRRSPEVLPGRPAARALPGWQEPEEARAWLVAEQAALLAVERHSRSHGRPARAARLAHVLADFLDAEGYWEAAELHTHAVGHWCAVHDRASEARALVDLTTVQYRTGRYGQAEGNGHRALELARTMGDIATEAESLRMLGLLAWDVGRLDDSLVLQREALDIRSKLGDPWHIARYQNNLGITLLQLGDHDGAMKNFRLSLFGFVRAKDERGEAQALNNLGDLHLHRGENEAARASFSRSLDLVMRVGSRTEQAIAQLNLGSSLLTPENSSQALTLHRQALSTFRLINDKRCEAITLNAVGKNMLSAGRPMEASAHYAAALDLARRIGAVQEEIQALRGVAMAELSYGRGADAEEQLTTALSLAERIHATDEEAGSHADLATFHLAAGRQGEAAAHLEEAIAFFSGHNENESDRLRRLLLDIRADDADESAEAQEAAGHSQNGHPKNGTYKRF
ncbi:BTAD domain-containing putative transcriptional regulator [Streptomyces sp. NBC_00932]|uniref:AfsR/SARP family transcriptional regulator n=1 Tax=Streptomyces sp. NBC_00932 TaxID=2903690 RepID=UPI00386AEB02|nr:tetratricopeptide repeat protein [Streptomyces sp. NBC_00932]